MRSAPPQQTLLLAPDLHHLDPPKVVDFKGPPFRSSIGGQAIFSTRHLTAYSFLRPIIGYCRANRRRCHLKTCTQHKARQAQHSMGETRILTKIHPRVMCATMLSRTTSSTRLKHISPPGSLMRLVLPPQHSFDIAGNPALPDIPQAKRIISLA